MQRVLWLSAGLHALAVASVLLLRLPPLGEPDEPPRIEVVFGHSGRLALAAEAPRPPVPAPRDGAPAPAHAASGEAAGVAAAVPQPEIARAATPDPGLQVERPDPTMIPAREADGNLGPEYPEEAQREHLEGTVLLRLHIGADGAVTRIETLQSSGSAVLDAAARAMLARWRFLPARQGGRPVASYRDQPVEFVLNKRAGL